MRKIKFYRFETGKSPVEEYFDSLTNKQFEKVAFVLDIIEQLDIVPRKFSRNFKALMIFGRLGYSWAITYFGYWVFWMGRTL